MNRRLQALGRMKRGVMNRTESAYERVLQDRVKCGEIAWYRFEGMTFKIAKDTRYTPDFVVMLSNGEIEAHEVKGSRFIFADDAKVKCKVFAEQYPIRLIVVYPKKGGGWENEEF